MQNKSDVYKPIDIQSMTTVVGESISAIGMWNIIVNQLRKHDFSCGQAVNNLKGRKTSSQMNQIK